MEEGNEQQAGGQADRRASEQPAQGGGGVESGEGRGGREEGKSEEGGVKSEGPAADPSPLIPGPSSPSSDSDPTDATTPDATTPVLPAADSEQNFPPITRKNFYKHPIFWARFLGYAIPLGFLLYVLYLNYLPFGYHKTFTINVGSPNDTKVSEFYLEPSKDLSEPKTAQDGTTYRELNGMATAVFKPNVVLKNAEVTVEVKGDGVSLIPPQIDFDPNSVKWDYSWDFTKGTPSALTNINDRAFELEGGTYFDGTAQVEMASSSDMFEEGPFAIYAEWTPTNEIDDYQEIVGHFNWELFQNRNGVSFRIGRMNDSQGLFYTINSKFDDPDTFFNQKHTCLVQYIPDKRTSKGYIEMYVDNKFVERKPIFGDAIYKDYNQKINLSFGKSEYSVAHFYDGLVWGIKIGSPVQIQQNQITILNFSDSASRIQLSSNSTTTLTQITLNAHQENNRKH